MVIASAARTASKAELKPYAAGELNVLSLEADEALPAPAPAWARPGSGSPSEN